MLCEKIIGRIEDSEFIGKPVDFVEIDWHETYNKILRKTSKSGRDVAIRLGDDILKIGMKPGDVLGVDSDGTVLAVEVPATDVLVVTVEESSAFNFAKVGYEIGNCHAPLFAGEADNQFVTIFNEPMEHLLSHLYHVKVERKVQKLNFAKQISTIVGHGHSHGEHHHHE